MNSNQQTFQYETLIYTINKNNAAIVIQIMKNKQVEAEKTFTFEQMKNMSPGFYLFPSLQSIYDVLVSLAKENKTTIKESKDFYMFVLNISCKELSSIELLIPMKINTPDHPLFKAINTRVDMMSELINLINTRLETLDTRLDKQEVLITKQEELEARFDKQDAIIDSIESQLKTILDKQESLISEQNTKLDSLESKLSDQQNVNALETTFNNRFDKQDEIINNIIESIKTIQLSDDDINSLIFLSQEERNIVSEIIFKAKKYKWKLLFNPKEGQDTYEYCHASFYNRPSIVVFIETIKGCKFGLYTSVGWETPTDGCNIVLLLIYYV